MFERIDTKDFKINPFTKIGTDKMLITAGDGCEFNTMTASWGTLGTLWNKAVLTAYIRHSRYTHAFAEKSDYATFSFFGGCESPLKDCDVKKIFSLCGSKSGRDTDKISACGLTPIHHPDGAVYFEEANLVIIGKKIYSSEITAAGFADRHCLSFYSDYSNGDFHTSYVYEITEILSKIDKT
ncbi:MAG: flavin reductase family protein [Eubacteriales bacterium]|nr:flavin reductase family protein [Eubacteriales bacterium]